MKQTTLKIMVILAVISIVAQLTFGQERKTGTNAKPIPIDKLSEEILPLPLNSSLTPAKFFDMKLNSISQVTLNLYDESKTRLSTIVVAEDVIKKTFEYKISSPNLDTEWVRINNQIKDGKNIASALSSSEKSMKILTLKGKDINGCQEKTSLTEIEVIDSNGFSRKFSQDIQTKEQQEEIQSILKQAEGELYNTAQLKTLREVILSLHRLQIAVAENSAKQIKKV